MSDQPKLHAYAVACAFGTPEATDPPARLIISVWIAYVPQEAAAMAMDQTHRTVAAAGQALPAFAGTTTFEITEDHLSHMLNALRTGGKGATVLQAVPPAEPQCDHAWRRSLTAANVPTWFCEKCGMRSAQEPPPHQMNPQEGASNNPFPGQQHQNWPNPVPPWGDPA